MTHIALIHNGRAGSTVLLSLLTQSPELVTSHEPFLGYFGAYRDELRERGSFVDYPWSRSHHYPHAPLAYLRELSPEPPLRYLASIKLYHLRGVGLGIEPFLEALPELGYSHVVFLNRANYLRKVVSCLVAEARLASGAGESYFNPGGAPVERPSISLDLDAIELDSTRRPLREFFAEWDTDVAELRAGLADRPHLELEYARDLRQDPRQGCNAVREYIGVAATPVELGLGRTTPFSLAEIVTNYDELCRYLDDTPWAWMLDG